MLTFRELRDSDLNGFVPCFSFILTHKEILVNTFSSNLFEVFLKIFFEIFALEINT